MAVPKHISFVLDGNRRWAAQAGLPAWAGHQRALDVINDLVVWSREAGVAYLTLYLFSTENWGRAEEELSNLFGRVATVAIEQKFPQLIEAGARINLWGELDKFPTAMQTALHKLVEDSKNNDGIVVNFCLGYGGRDEIARAVQVLAKEGVAVDAVNTEMIGQKLFSAHTPDPDMMIRTGGERRLSNFLLWQHAYSELYFIDTLLPDFGREDFEAALQWYANRGRRFGR